MMRFCVILFASALSAAAQYGASLSLMNPWQCGNSTNANVYPAFSGQGAAVSNGSTIATHVGGGVWSFNTSGAFVVRSSSNVIVGASGFSAAMWFKIGRFKTGSPADNILVSKDSIFAAGAWNRETVVDIFSTSANSATQIYFAVNDHGTSASVAMQRIANLSATISTGVWHHFAATYNGGSSKTTADMRMFLDGAQLVVTNFPGTATAITNQTRAVNADWVFGGFDVRLDGQNGFGEIGYLTRFGIWQRPLTDNEIYALRGVDLMNAQGGQWP